MIICPNCQSKEMSGSIYCSKCGAQLTNEGVATLKIQTAETNKVPVRRAGHSQPPPPPDVPLQSRISLNMIDYDQVLPLADRIEFTLGRSAEGQPIVPDVDLSPFNAFSNGVSRLHAVIKLNQDNIILMDMGSSNGTFLNGNRLPPYIESKLTHGDVIDLGKLKMQVLIG